MNLFDIFKNRDKNTKHLLRIFANMGKNGYSNKEKMELSECVINTAKDLLKTTKLKFDIFGSGYGISKGSNYFEERSYRNKIAKKGYKAMWGMHVESEELKYESQFLLITNQESSNRFEGSFSWSLESDPRTERAFEILNRIADVCCVDYAYSYPVPDMILNGEWHMKRGLLGNTSFRPQAEKLWDNHLNEIIKGKIKKLYPINYFNSKQLSYLSEVTPDDQRMVANGAELWKLSNPQIIQGNRTLSNVVLKEK